LRRWGEPLFRNITYFEERTLYRSLSILYPIRPKSSHAFDHNDDNEATKTMNLWSRIYICPESASSFAKKIVLTGLPNFDCNKNRSSTQYTTINYVSTSFVRFHCFSFLLLHNNIIYLHIYVPTSYPSHVSKRVQQL